MARRIRTARGTNEEIANAGDDRLLRLDAVAARLDVNLRTLQGWISAGKLRALRFSSRCTRIDPRELERFLRDSGGGE